MNNDPSLTSGEEIHTREIERKFVLSELPLQLLDSVEPLHIEQGYIRTRGDVESRVRAIDESEYVFTVKSGEGLDRGEKNTTITAAEFEALWPFTENARIRKSRYPIPHRDGLTVELDVFTDELDGLIEAEVEFASLADAETYDADPWLGLEVTGNKLYGNKSLALRGIDGGKEYVTPHGELAQGVESLITYVNVLAFSLRRPITVAVAGGSASGKTSAVADKVGEHFGDRAIVLSMDDYYKGTAFMESQKAVGVELNWDQPEAVDIELAAKHLAELRAGRPIEKPIYDFKTGERVGYEVVDPTKTRIDAIVIEGLFALTDAVAEAADITTFVDIETHGRMMRRLLRDVVRTGWDPSQILGYFKTLEDMHQAYVAPTIGNADIIIDNGYNARVEAMRAGMSEVQVKYPVTELTLEQLRQSGAELISPRTRQVDTYYNPKVGDFGLSDEIIRTRETAGQILFGYKGPRFDDPSTRRRPKIEFPITAEALADFEQVYQQPTKRIYKDRSMSLYHGVLIALDEVHVSDAGDIRDVGAFVELRTNDESDAGRQLLEDIASQLGLDPATRELRCYDEM